ncbi:hypothetical protein WEI85_29050 [Actinomycetes bacterium KLBMP 9797]
MVRRRVILGGLSLGGLLAAVLALAGVVHVRVIDEAGPAASPARAPRPHTATQPELADALLAADDLPEGYRPTRAPASPTTESDRTGRCRALFERPWEMGRATDRALADYAGQRDGSLLRQALALFDPAGADRAFGELRAASRACPAFEARLEDGTAVRVHLREMALQQVGDEVYAVRLITRGERGTQHGYLAVGRVGPVLSVLCHLGQEAVDADLVSGTLRQALDRARVIPAAPERS